MKNTLKCKNCIEAIVHQRLLWFDKEFNEFVILAWNLYTKFEKFTVVVNKDELLIQLPNTDAVKASS